MLIPLHLHDYLIEQQKLDYKLTQKLIWFIHHLNISRFTNAYNATTSSEIHISYDYLERILTTKSCSIVLKKLENDGIIDVNHSYQFFSDGSGKKGYCKTYKFVNNKPHSSTFWCINGVQTINPIESNKLKNKVLELIKNTKGVALYLDQLKNIKFINTPILDLSGDDETVFYNMRNYLMIERIQNNEHYANFDNYGRLHTNLTVLKTEYRNQLTFINNPIVNLNGKNIQLSENQIVDSVDIVCSQLFMLLITLINKNQNLKGSYEVNKLHNLLMGNKQDKTDFYSYILKLTNLQMNRKDFKTEFFSRYLYAKNFEHYVNDSNIINTIMRTEFPILHEEILQLKKNDYKSLPRLMQKVESDYIFKDVIPNLQMRNIPFFTVHDSVHFPKNDEIKIFVKNVMISKFFNKTGIHLNVE